MKLSLLMEKRPVRITNFKHLVIAFVKKTQQHRSKTDPEFNLLFSPTVSGTRNSFNLYDWIFLTKILLESHS